MADRLQSLCEQLVLDAQLCRNDNAEQHEWFRPVVQVFREQEPAAHIVVGHPYMHAAMAVALLGCADFHADEVALVFDSYQALVDHNPITGMEWQPGEMSAVWAHPGAVRLGWMTDALAAVVMNRDLDTYQMTQPYRLDGTRVFWDEPMQVVEGHWLWRLTSGLREAVQDCMTHLPVLPELPPDTWQALGDTDEIRRATMDLVLAQLIQLPPLQLVKDIGLMPGNVVVLAALPGTARMSVIMDNPGGAERWI